MNFFHDSNRPCEHSVQWALTQQALRVRPYSLHLFIFLVSAGAKLRVPKNLTCFSKQSQCQNVCQPVVPICKKLPVVHKLFTYKLPE